MQLTDAAPHEVATAEAGAPSAPAPVDSPDWPNIHARDTHIARVDARADRFPSLRRLLQNPSVIAGVTLLSPILVAIL